MAPSHVFFFRSALFVVLSIAVIFLIKPYIISLVAGAIFAMVLLPIQNRWKPKLLGPRWKAAIITLGFTCAFVIPMGMAFYSATNTGLKHIKQLQSENNAGGDLIRGNTTAAIESWMDKSPRVKEFVQRLPIDKSRVFKLADDGITKVGGIVRDFGQSFLTALPSMIFGTVVLLATVFFILSDGAKGRGVIDFNPLFSVERTREIVRTFQEASFSVVVASVISGMCQASVLVIASIVTGKGSPVLIGVIAFFFSFLPVLGVTPVSVMLVLSQLVMGDTRSAMYFVGFGIIASIADNIIVPWIVGDHAKIHPMIVFVSAFGGIEMIGVYGLFIGPVVTATFIKVVSILGRNQELEPSSPGIVDASTKASIFRLTYKN